MAAGGRESMTSPKRRPSQGDPRLRALLLLLIGGAILYASFDRGMNPAATERVVRQAVQAEEDAVDNGGRQEGAVTDYAQTRAILPTGRHRRELVTQARAAVTISAPVAVRVEDLADPGRYRCNVGLAVTNGAGQPIDNLEFGVRYTGAGGTGSTIHRVQIAPLAQQSITPVPAVTGPCEGLSGAVRVYRCTFLDGTDCMPFVVILPEGPVALVRAS